MSYEKFCERKRYYDQLFLDRLDAYCEVYKNEDLYFKNSAGVVNKRTWTNSYGVYLLAKDKRMIEIEHDAFQIEYTYKIDDYCGGDEEEYLTARGQICSIENQEHFEIWLKVCKDTIREVNEILRKEYEKAEAQRISVEEMTLEEKERMEYERLKAKFEKKDEDEIVYKFDLRDIPYIDDFDEDGIRRLLEREFEWKIDGSIELYKWQDINSTSPYLLRKYTKEEAQALQKGC